MTGDDEAAARSGSGTAEPTTATIEGFQAIGFFAADYATVESGKIYSSGGYWAILRFPAFPANLPSASLAAAVQIPFHANQADHTFAFGLEDADRNPQAQFRIEGAFRSAPTIETSYGEAGTWTIAVPIYGLTFEKPGTYSFTLSIDNKEIARYQFKVVQSATFGPLPPSSPVGGAGR